MNFTITTLNNIKNEYESKINRLDMMNSCDHYDDGYVCALYEAIDITESNIKIIEAFEHLEAEPKTTI